MQRNYFQFNAMQEGVQFPVFYRVEEKHRKLEVFNNIGGKNLDSIIYLKLSSSK